MCTNSRLSGALRLFAWAIRLHVIQSYAQYTSPTPTRRNCRVESRRRCVGLHEFATSWRQFRRVVGVNTPVGSRDQFCKLAADGCVVRSNPSAVVANSCTHRRRDATKQFRLVGGVYWALQTEVKSINSPKPSTTERRLEAIHEAIKHKTQTI